ncbi:MAG: hydroxymethylbilane synthase [Eubacterium sp.]|nr:hydroxymethylbilane synthase [Eubacterium sp.]
MRYIIASRGSKLALTQTEYVRSRLAAAYPQHEFQIQVVKTKGDLILDKPLHEIGDKGVFVKEIEEKILNHEADLGVHSMKDMPSAPACGLMFAKAWKREDPRDVLILREKKSLEELPQGAVIGTGSRRREFQLKRLRPDLHITGIRGNVDTRLRKMLEQQLDGIVLAAAGLKRMGLEERITQYLPPAQMIHAPAQGILALEIRTDDKVLLEMINALSDEETVQAAAAERGFLELIGGDCHIPVGAAFSKHADGTYQLDVMYGNESGSRQAYAAVRGKDPSVLAAQAAVKIRRQIAGTVYLVGAGPGDPGLITVKGLAAVREADCIIYDRLAAPELLEEAKPGCEKIYAGKASHNHTMPQDEINRLALRKSMEYEKTVRLKGGDVYVFGRGGEEGLFLHENGVRIEVVPGISSSTAGAAYAGIPVTHRGMARGFHVVTAHDKDDKLAEIDFKAMASGRDTCIFLMGLSKVEEIARRLTEAGMPDTTRAAVISHATTLSQKTCVSDLAHIAEEVKKAGLTSPALIVAGDVVALRDELNFFEQRPLFGRRYLIPKIGKKATRLRKLLQDQGACADEIQVGEIVNADDTFDPKSFEHADWMIFTSKNGVEAFFDLSVRHRQDVRCLAQCRIAAIGTKTAEALALRGLYADLMPEHFHSDALVEALKSRLSGGEQVCYIKAENADGHMGEALAGYCQFEEIVLYKNQAVEPDLTTVRPLAEYDGILFTCASSARRLFEALGDGWKCGVKLFSIGPKTTACLKELGADSVWEAERATYEALAEFERHRLK